MSGALVLDGELTIYRASELKPLIVAALRSNGDPPEVTFDLSQVTEIDTAGVQLLLMARQDAAARDGTVHLADASTSVRDAFALLELDAHLLPAPASA